jgi:hypothetical protein
MPYHPPRVGLCIIRLEREGARVLVSLRLAADITEGSGERQHRFTDIDLALQVVHDFMTSFVQRPSDPDPGCS